MTTYQIGDFAETQNGMEARILSDAERIAELEQQVERLREVGKAALPFLRHDGRCAAIGGYGFCDCGRDKARAALTRGQS